LKNKAGADLRHTERALARVADRLEPGQRAKIDAATVALRAAAGGSDVQALGRAVDAFGDATAPLAELLMNATVKDLLAGKTEDQIATAADDKETRS
jgi:molecular chaperone DnaK